VLAPKPVGRRATLSGDELILLLGGARTGLFLRRLWRARSWSLRGQSGRRPRLAVAQQCSDVAGSIGCRGKVLKGWQWWRCDSAFRI